MLVSFEELTQYLASAIEQVWEAEWRRDDLCLALTQVYSKAQIKEMMNALGRSHQDVYRWAERAQEFPPLTRALDRSPRWHAQEAKKRAGSSEIQDQGSDLASQVGAAGSGKEREVKRSRRRVLGPQDHSTSLVVAGEGSGGSLGASLEA